MTDEITSFLATVRARSHPGRGGQTRSAVRLWMENHYTALASEFDQAPPSWRVVADAMGKLGIRMRDGSPPTADAVMSAWYRIKRERNSIRKLS